MNRKLEQLLKKQEALNAQIQQLKLKEAEAQRKRDTRRRTLLGALMMEMLERGELEQETIWKRLDGFLVKQGDRVLFDLPERVSEQPQEDIEGEKTEKEEVEDIGGKDIREEAEKEEYGEEYEEENGEECEEEDDEE